MTDQAGHLTAREKGAARIAELQAAVPGIPRTLAVKADVLREGINVSAALAELSAWAFPHTHILFDWDHDDTHDAAGAAEGFYMIPQKFYFSNGTTALIKIDVESPYTIDFAGYGRYQLRRNGEPIDEVFFEPRPRWFTRKTRDGRMMAKVAVGVKDCIFYFSVLNHCEYFNRGEECAFCNMEPTADRNLELLSDKMVSRSIQQILDTYAAASAEFSIRHIAMSGGSFYRREREVELYLKFVTALRKSGIGDPEIPIYLSCQAFSRDDNARLREAGVACVTNNIEVWDPQLFHAITPGKAKYVGRDRWLRDMEAAVEVFGAGNVRSNFTAGVEMVHPNGFGAIEPAVASTLEGFRWLLDRGIVPIFTVYTPTPGSALANMGPPPTEYFLTLCAQQHRLLNEYRVTLPAYNCVKCDVLGFEYDYAVKDSALPDQQGGRREET
ncbi:MAG: radical SAM protein [Candidatus Binatia bacterium]